MNSLSNLNTINLTKISINPNTKFRLKAEIVGSKDKTYNIILEFIPDCKLSACFRLEGTAFKTWFSYLGTIPNTN